MKQLALLLLLLALGALGLVACGGGDEDAVTAASEIETTGDRTTRAELAADNKSCGTFLPDHDPPFRLAVGEGDISCRVARRVMHDWADDRLPGSWGCTGPEANVVCTKEPGASSRAGASSRLVITARFAREAVEADPENENRLSGEERIEQMGNEWALLFAKADPETCGYYEGQPACEREVGDCTAVSGYRTRNCTPLSAEFRKSFANATVERVVVEGRDATAEFSNGESVEFAGGLFRTTGGLWRITVNTVKNFER